MFSTILSLIIAVLPATSQPTTHPDNEPPVLALRDHHLIVESDEKSTSWLSEQNGLDFRYISTGFGTVNIDGRWSEIIDGSYIQGEFSLTQSKDGTVEVHIDFEGEDKLDFPNFEDAYKYPLIRKIFDEQFLSVLNTPDFITTRFNRAVNDPHWKPSPEMDKTFPILLDQLNNPHWKLRVKAQREIEKMGLSGVVYIVKKVNRKSMSAEQNVRLDWIVSKYR